MADVNAIYQGQFLRAAQLGGQTRRVKIAAAAVEVIGQGDKAAQKIVLTFERTKPRLPLNKTNATAIAAAWGPETSNWLGRELELRPERVLFSGNMVDSIRCHVPAAPAAAQAAQVPAGGGIAEMSDDVPW
jgi:hypothetical protein